MLDLKIFFFVPIDPLCNLCLVIFGLSLKSYYMTLITDTGIAILVSKLSRLIVLFSSTNSFWKNPVF